MMGSDRLVAYIENTDDMNTSSSKQYGSFRSPSYKTRFISTPLILNSGQSNVKLLE